MFEAYNKSLPLSSARFCVCVCDGESVCVSDSESVCVIECVCVRESE